MSNVWQNNLILEKADFFAHQIYSISKSFPKSEIYGLTSQIRRVSVSVVLNMIEGYSRFKHKSHIHFLEISFGSLKETHYLIDFRLQEGILSKKSASLLLELCNEIEKMLYSKIKTLKSK